MIDLVLHWYWRSSAAYRVRIALNLTAAAALGLLRPADHDAQQRADR